MHKNWPFQQPDHAFTVALQPLTRLSDRNFETSTVLKTTAYLKVSRLAATKYLDALAAGGLLHKVKVGRSNYYVNVALNAILTRAGNV